MIVKSLSDFGLTKYAAREDGLIFNTVRVCEVVPYLTRHGYLRVRLYDDLGGSSKQFVHRLVALAFHHDSFSGGLIVNHIDSNRINNHFSNLEWCTYAENSMHAKENYRLATGERHGKSRLSDEEVEVICKSNLPLANLAKMYGVSRQAISYRKRIFKEKGGHIGDA